MIWKYIIIWLPMILLAVINGAIREVYFKETLGELRANQISTISLLIILGVYIWIVIKKWTPRSSQEALLAGSMWLFLTILFESIFGYFIGGKPWYILFAEYDIFHGRLWILIPLWVAIAPYLYFRRWTSLRVRERKDI